MQSDSTPVKTPVKKNASAKKAVKKAAAAVVSDDSDDSEDESDSDVSNLSSSFSKTSVTTPAKTPVKKAASSAAASSAAASSPSDDAVSSTSLSDVVGELQDWTHMLDSFFGENVEERPTKDDVKMLLKQYSLTNESINAICKSYKMKIPKEKKKVDGERGGGGGGGAKNPSSGKTDIDDLDIYEDEDPTTRDKRMIKEAYDEVNVCGHAHWHLSFNEQLSNISKLFESQLAQLPSVDVNTMDHSQCVVTSDTIVKLDETLNNYTLLLKYRLGSVFERHAHLVNSKTPFSREFHSVMYHDWREYYKARLGLSDRAIRHHCDFFALVKRMPSLVKSTKPWTWFINHFYKGRLAEAITIVCKENAHKIKNAQEAEELKERGYMEFYNAAMLKLKAEQAAAAVVSPVKASSS